MKRLFLVAMPVLTVLWWCAISVCAQTAQSPEAGEPDTAAFEALAAANTGKEILSRHTNFEMNRSIFRDEEEVCTEMNYRDADIYLWNSDSGVETLSRADLWVNRYVEDGESNYVETIFDTEEGIIYSFEYSRDNSIIILDEKETLVETMDDGDGRFVAVTEISDFELVKQVLETYASMGSYEYTEGMTLRYQYTFDKETTDLLSIDALLIDENGEEYTYIAESYAYDVEAYDPAAEGEPFAEYYAAAQDPEQSHTITVTFDPEEENERTVVYTMPNNMYFLILCDGVYVEEMYTDRECTQLFEKGDGVTDLELYVR